MAKSNRDDVGDGVQTLFSHLIELRSRLLKAALTVLMVLVVLVLVPLANRLYTELAAPLVARLPVGAHLIATQVTSPFITSLKLALYTAIFVSMPMIVYQLWAFVSPGLYRREKCLARPLLIAAITLFYVGCAFAYFLVLPAAFKFLTAVIPQCVEMMTDINHYLNFVVLMFFAFSLCFEVPVVLVILSAVVYRQCWQAAPVAALRLRGCICRRCRGDATRCHLDVPSGYPDVPALRARRGRREYIGAPTCARRFRRRRQKRIGMCLPTVSRQGCAGDVGRVAPTA